MPINHDQVRRIRHTLAVAGLALVASVYVATCAPDAHAQIVNPSQPATGVPVAGTGISVAGQTVSVNYGVANSPFTGNMSVGGTFSATGAVSGTGFSNLFAIPYPIGSTTPNTAAFTTLSASSTVSGAGFTNLFASPPPVGSTAANTGAFTTLATSGTHTATGASVLNGTVSGTGIATYETTVNHVQTVANVAALRALSCVPNLFYADQGYTTIADGGQATFVCNGADTTTPDNGGTILATANANRLYMLTPGKAVNILQFGARCNGSTDDTTAIQSAVTWAIGQSSFRVEVPETTSFCLISNTINAGDATHAYAGFQLIGLGLPTIQSSLLTAPILSVSGERFDIEGLRLQYASQPTSGQTNAVAIRVYNLYESIIRRMYFNLVNTAIDQYQGACNVSATPTTAGAFVVGTPYVINTVGTTNFTLIGAASNTVGVNFIATGAGTGTGTANPGSQNAFYSNHLSDWRVAAWSNFAINLIPYAGGNSGNLWDNIYLTNNLLTSSGGVNIQTSSDSVYNQFNIEHGTMGTALVCNQCDSTVFNGLHIEGVTLSASFQPLIDIYNSTVTFNSLDATYNTWGASSPQYVFRASTADGSTIIVNGMVSRNNTTPATMNFATIVYGNYLFAQGVKDIDGSLSSSANVPRVNVTGSPSAGVDYPIAQYNRAAGILRQREGTNGKQVTGTLVAGTVTITNATVTSTSRILCTRQPGGANPGAVYVPTITAGTSFVVTSTNAGDTGNVACEISEAN